MKKLVKQIYRKAIFIFWHVKNLGGRADFSVDQLDEIKRVPLGKTGRVKIFDQFFRFHHANSFVETYDEIFVEEIYKFIPDTKTPYIVDCGANMGLSVLYFAKSFPNAIIDAFEPEKPIFDILDENVSAYSLTNVRLHNKAVWSSETVLEFFTDTGMGGSIENSYYGQAPTKVTTVRLRDYLQKTVDFLKVDIEGAELAVLKDCSLELKNVRHLFVEYHSFKGKDQQLDALLTLLKDAGFRYHLKRSFSRQHPFVDRTFACENIDMAINVFAYRKA